MEKNYLRMNEFFNFTEELKKHEGFKSTIKENIFRMCRENPIKNHGKLIVSKGCYNKIANKKRNYITLDYITNKHNLIYSLENDNTILFFRRA